MTVQKSFVEKLTDRIERNNSLLCVGLDPDPKSYPAAFPATIDAPALAAWGRRLIEQTAELVCCYKPNFAFYEQYGPAGLEALRQTIEAVPDGIPVLLDAKRGDIGSTAAAYARAAFEIWGADAVTVSPYLGRDSIAPFLDYPGKMVFVLSYTSNPSAQTIQEFGGETNRLFEHVVKQAQTWGSVEQVGFVVGATQPHALAQVRRLMAGGGHWILAPGVGAQGGDLSAALAAGLNQNGSGLIVPVSRGVIYADKPGQAALALRDEINQARQAISPPKAEAGSPYLDLIIQLHKIGCIQFGQFTLASGKPSPIYIDLRRIAASPAVLKMAAQVYADLIRPLTYDHIAAVPYAALTIGTAVALETGRPLIYPRKEAKAYGTGQTVEGVFAAGDKAVIIEDLVTSGGSVIKAVEQLKAVGITVTDAAVLIDREQGGRANLAAEGCQLHAALQLSDILATLYAAGRISAEQLAEVKQYLAS
ncbi:MAG: orotidine-5'-phosphate decarboxylase [Anaerolineaceae bacterium]|nr:orotidine-5'-phosphate decarboxylase [Anaerolineaceae bacterium]MCB9102093.1 orotidine-5'-phosphate decarboxylase [Anaerolineales bacterium]